MHAFLIIGSEEKRNSKIDSLLTERGISSFDRIFAQSEAGSSIGISDIRAFIALLSLTPSTPAGQAGIIASGELLTAEAQQALLKILEEPPIGTSLYIGILNASMLLPTILSRCTVVSAPSGANSEPDTQTASEIEQLLSGTPGSVIHTVSVIGKTKDDLNAWIDRAIHTLRNTLISDANMNHRSPLFTKKTRILRKLLEVKQYQKNNVSPYLLVEQAFISTIEKNEAV